MKKEGGFTSKAAGTFITLGTVAVLNFVVNLVMARVLGPLGKGIITPSLNIATIAITLGTLGLGTSIAFHLDKKPFRAKDVMLTSLLVSLLSGLISAAATYFIISASVPETSLYSRILFSSGTLFTVVYSVMHGGLLGRNRIGWMNLATLASTIFRTLLCILLLYFLWPSVEGFALSYATAQLMNSILVIALSFKETGFKHARIDLSFMKQAIVFSIAVYLGMIALEATSAIGMILLKQFRSPQEVGIVSQAQTVTRLLMLIPQALATALYGAVIGETGKEQFAARAIRLSFFATLLIGILLAVLAPWLIPFLFKKAFIPSVPYLWGLLPATVLYTVPQLYTSLVIASWGKPWHFFISSAISLLITVVLNVFLIPVYGGWGTVIAYAASVIFMTAYYIVLLLKKGGLSMGDIFVPKVEDFNVLMRRLGLKRGS